MSFFGYNYNQSITKSNKIPFHHRDQVDIIRTSFEQPQKPKRNATIFKHKKRTVWRHSRESK